MIKALVNSDVQRGPLRLLGLLAFILLLLAWAAVPGLTYVDRKLPPKHNSAPDEPNRTVHRIVVGGAAVITAGSVWVQLTEPVTGPQAFGGLGVVLTFFTAAAVLGGAAVAFADWWVDRHDLPPAFAAFRLKAIPVFTLFLVWGIVAGLIDDGQHWNVRTRPGAIPQGMDLETAFETWLTEARNRAGPMTAGDRRAIPLVIVSTSGGGIRAAYWTALALDCIFSGRQAPTGPADDMPCKPGPQAARTVTRADVFLASGISGGSLGLVAWEANQDLVDRRLSQDGWVDERLGEDDFVSPSLARALLTEIPRTFLHFEAADRAEVIEEAWEEAWSDTAGNNPMGTGFLAAQQAAAEGGQPILLLNGASVFDGCALNVSLLQAGSTSKADPTDCLSVDRYRDKSTAGDEAGPLPATADILDYLVGCVPAVDLRRSTAALLSARFPYVSPAGRITKCGDDSTARYIVDGGYVDTSGTETAMAIWEGLEQLVADKNDTSADSCIVPYFLQLDNGYLSSGSPKNKTKPPNQMLAPVQALWNATGLQSRASRARASAAEQFARHGVSRYSIVVPQSHPGLEAPLGWTLAETSRRDLERELYTGNEAEIRKLRAFLEEPTCASTPT